MKIALDAMGGDHAPHEILLGAIQAKRALDIELVLVGNRETIQSTLHKIASADVAPLPNFEIVNAADVVHFDQNPSSVKERHDASIRIICELVKQGHADACLTMGHTGAGIIASLITFGRIGEVLRPCVGLPYFGLQPHTLLVDAGAIVDCKPEYLAQFALMGSIYVEKIWGIENPTVGLMTNGREHNKGNALTRATFPLLEASGLNFVGNLEGYDLPNGVANVIVTDGLWGNIATKMTEALSDQLLDRLAQRFADTGLETVARPILDEFRAMMDYTTIGAAPVLGVDGLILIGHGRSRAAAVVGGIKSTIHAYEVDLLQALRMGLRAPSE